MTCDYPFAMRYLRVLLFAAYAVLLIGCQSIPTPVGIDDSLPTAVPESVGLNTSRFAMLEGQLESENHKLHSFLIAKGGALVYERYYNGYGPENPHDLRSATKSLTATLTGIALEDEIIASVNDPISAAPGKVYPSVADSSMRFSDLLTMRTGRACDDHDPVSPGHEDRMYRARDWTEFFLSLSSTAAPGTESRYCTGGVVTLGRAIQEASGERFDEWAKKKFFEPLGIRNYYWEYYDKGRSVDTGGHLHLTPRGLIRIGLMLLDDGRWGEKQIVSERWIKEMWTVRSTLHWTDYGYLWWIYQIPTNTGPLNVYPARGNGGQTLYLVPNLDLAVVVTAGYYNDKRAAVVDQIFSNIVLPAAGVQISREQYVGDS